MMRKKLQQRVETWMWKCFGQRIARDVLERCFRFYEEATELVQANGMTREDAHLLVDYVYDRPKGEPYQETGGVMITLAALSSSTRIDMMAAGDDELARVDTDEKIQVIRAKQATKPKHSPLPGSAPESTLSDK
jgi:hypothetical protein